MSDDLSKASAMDVSLNLDRISTFAEVLFMRSWLLFKINGDAEFVTSDDPLLIMNGNSLDVTPFKNGLAKESTIKFYPLSSKQLIAMYSPNMLL